MALAALAALAADHEVVAIVRARPVRPPHRSWRGVAAGLARRLGLLPTDPVTAWAAAAGVPVVGTSGNGEQAAHRLRAFGSEVGCIATFPRRIPDTLLAAAGRICVNLHPSLLPRHRGPNPLFWTYHAGDADSGVTIHQATPQIDAGAIFLQDRFPVARGESVVDVHARCATLGGAMLSRAVAQLASGQAVSVEQDETMVSLAPSPVPGRSYAALDAWPCAQAWHFLAGLVARYREPLVDNTGAPVSYTRVVGYEERRTLHAPGSVLREGSSWIAWTPDGVVTLS